MKNGLFALTGVFLFCTGTSHANIAPGIDNHIKGDVIAVRTDSQIAVWCDFDKQIVVTQTNVLCVYNGNKSSPNGF